MKKTLILLTAVAVFALTVLPALATIDPGLDYPASIGLGTKDLRQSVMEVVTVLLGFLGVLAIVIILWGGFRWLTSAGNEEKVGEAKKIITAGIIGLVIIFLSFAITSFVITQLMSATGAS